MLSWRLVGGAMLVYVCSAISTVVAAGAGTPPLDRAVSAALATAGFTGTIEQTFRARLETTLGRRIDPKLAEIGRLLWFDTLHSLHGDNTCGGCHSPTNGFGDTQGIAIGVQNNDLVGPHRTGPLNQRRSPLVVNAALYPALMWNGRFNAASGDPFDGTQGFRFPFPEGDVRFSAASNAAHGLTHLLQAQAHMPPTELVEVAGFTNTCPHGVADTIIGPAFCQFDDGIGEPVPLPEPITGSRNEPIRDKALALLNATPAYRQLFGDVFPEVRQGTPIGAYELLLAACALRWGLMLVTHDAREFGRVGGLGLEDWRGR